MGASLCCRDAHCLGSDPPPEGAVIVQMVSEEPPGDTTADPEQAGEFCVAVRKMGQPLGLDLEPTSAGLLVRSVGIGAIRGHNVKVYPGEQIMKHDIIVQVNKMQGSMDMLQELKIQDSLELLVCHPALLQAKLSKRIDQPLGARLTAHDARSTVLEIKEIVKHKGAIKAYNDHSQRASRIHVADCISRVNDISDCAEHMITELKAKADPIITLLRVKGMGQPASHHHGHNRDHSPDSVTSMTSMESTGSMSAAANPRQTRLASWLQSIDLAKAHAASQKRAIRTPEGLRRLQAQEEEWLDFCEEASLTARDLKKLENALASVDDAGPEAAGDRMSDRMPKRRSGWRGRTASDASNASDIRSSPRPTKASGFG